MNDRLSLGYGDRQQTNPCRSKSKAQASAEKLTSTVIEKKNWDQLANTIYMMWCVWVLICSIINMSLWERSTPWIDLYWNVSLFFCFSYLWVFSLVVQKKASLRHYFVCALSFLCQNHNLKECHFQIVRCMILRGESHPHITVTGKFTQLQLISINCKWVCVFRNRDIHLRDACQTLADLQLYKGLWWVNP